MSGSALDQPVVRLELELDDGELLVGEWTLGTIDQAPAWIKPAKGDGMCGPPPDWALDRRRRSDRPTDPITFRASVVPGFESAARAAVTGSG